MDELIDLVNKLQDLFSKFSRSPIDLPQIVVVGAQSSGKSSVLEHIVGESFLPRGTGVVTRCPLVLQLLQAPTQENKTEKLKTSYGIFQHDKDSKMFTDYNLICKEIENQTERLAGKNKGICDTPISLKLYSPSFTKLTLVDLPGITKVPVGDQPEDIEEQTKRLIIKYIENPNSIILAVTPANIDMATSESLKLAKEFDPDGERTLAVITKLDLMDEGTDAFDMLYGNVIPVKLGIIGVVNRSQKDITDKKSITESLRDETEFFNTHYNSIASKHGCTYLQKKVQGILIHHIHSCLPKLLETINEKLRTKNIELEQIDVDNLKKNELLLDLIKQFANNYVAAVNGHYTTMRSEDLYGGARVNNVFEELLPIALTSINALTGLTDSSIVTDMKNASGINSSIFVPETAFRLLVKKQIERLREPCIKSLDLVFKELNVIVENTIRDKSLRIERFPKLQRALSSAVEEFLQSRLPITKGNVDLLIDFHKAYINTRHPDFYTKAHEIFAMLNKNENNQNVLKLEETDEKRMKKSCTLLKDLIQIYFSIVRNIVIDAVPKIIMHSLVNYVVEHLDKELMKQLYSGDANNVNDIMQESSDYAKKLSVLKKEIKALNEARAEINNISFTHDILHG